ncbi:hypothetical protein M2103_000645 [Ereboglobus sp. PH5-5]|uniref:hypothetical protein n=1 Tax=unclassified Ereboglobus TaxID=2626932 RepID=UPI0024064F72|nr:MULTISPECIES: hypothetical protein [unclassified Ereboglobus]MDF9828198.1 hypothetical protein [Ereboglobus sp. PH5-10]MDF9832435.1 hypothetical protein [Ereboglobus sp. PH5-5]
MTSQASLPYPHTYSHTSSEAAVTLLLCLFISAYIVAAAYTLFHCAGAKKMRGKKRHMAGIILIPFLGTVLYWKNRVDALTETDAELASGNTRPPIPKAPDKYSSPPAPSHPPRYSTIPPFEFAAQSKPPFPTKSPFGTTVEKTSDKPETPDAPPPANDDLRTA